MFRLYKNPKAAGWLGWFEDANGKTEAFVGLDRKVVFMSDLSIHGEPAMPDLNQHHNSPAPDTSDGG